MQPLDLAKEVIFVKDLYERYCDYKSYYEELVSVSSADDEEDDIKESYSHTLDDFNASFERDEMDTLESIFTQIENPSCEKQVLIRMDYYLNEYAPTELPVVHINNNSYVLFKDLHD